MKLEYKKTIINFFPSMFGHLILKGKKHDYFYVKEDWKK